MEIILNFLIIETISSTKHQVCFYNLFEKTCKAIEKPKTWSIRSVLMETWGG